MSVPTESVPTESVPTQSGPTRPGAVVPEGVGWTAVLVAAQRAVESLSPVHLFRDPLAEAMVVQLGMAAPGAAPELDGAGVGGPSGATALMGDHLALRTAFFDQVVADALHCGIDQVVSVAAGLDGRAYRMPWPGTARLFELDRAEVLRFRHDVVARAGLTSTAPNRTEIEVDLDGDWPTELAARGFDPLRPTAWLVEGLTISLSRGENDTLMSRIAGLSTAGSRLFFEALDGPQREPAPDAWIRGHGWTPRVSMLTDLAAHGGRTPTPRADPAAGSPTVWLLDCRRP